MYSPDIKQTFPTFLNLTGTLFFLLAFLFSWQSYYASEGLLIYDIFILTLATDAFRDFAIQNLAVQSGIISWSPGTLTYCKSQQIFLPFCRQTYSHFTCARSWLKASQLQSESCASLLARCCTLIRITKAAWAHIPQIRIGWHLSNLELG